MTSGNGPAPGRGRVSGTERAAEALTHVPVRRCVGCRQPGERSVLLRFAVAEVDGQPVVVHDPARTLPGRGAWLHPDEDCWQLALRRSAFGRALRSSARLDQVGISEAIAALSPEHD